MGVGVFSEDFAGFGETFIIDRINILSRSNYYAILEYEEIPKPDVEAIKKIAEWLEVENLPSLAPAFQLVLEKAPLEGIQDAFRDASRPIVGSPRRPSLALVNGSVQFKALSLTIPVQDSSRLEALRDVRDYQQWCQDCDDDLREIIQEEIISPLVDLTDGVIQDSPDYDFNMSVLALLGRGHNLEITFREWEAYHWVVGVAVTPHLRDTLNDLRHASLNERRIFAADYAQGPATLEKNLQIGVQRLLRYLRLQFKSLGFDVQYKTSGHTTCSYTFPKRLHAAQDRAFEQFLAWTKKAA
ncbi:hypothetical protein [Acidithiobacillus caldus]|uniref:Uncharacterized protein n=1 Tax=Acidithiobacillus caldus TaxID=33059 RepID=A0A1E7YNG2_9PROT|nr:hypothetical protein [Acidithiobacillus caldus]OFC36611.1 hypothetical protein BAE27_05960 [Acidithiobacillus caldus]OFC38225.1 hypothetical protein BAE29_09215 [Acidithiobacillus caldus]OFC39317.1 hypothetical protein BAE28_03870 [Acidithiobacillus caldus]